MRKLQSTDFFTFTRIIKKMGIRQELKTIAKSATDIEAPKGKITKEEKIAFSKIQENKINEMQVEIIMIFVENISNAEDEVYKFISDISEKSVEELKDLKVFMDSIQEIFADETIKSFFRLALK